jgi:hypothetical protein
MSLAMSVPSGQSMAWRTGLNQGGPHPRHSEGTMKSKQAGISLMGFLIVVAVVGFFAFMGIKLVPSYIEYMGVVKAMNQISSEGVDGKTLDNVRRELLFKLGFQYVDDSTIHPSDITFQQGANGNELHVSYDKQVAFMYNIDFLIHFDKSVPVQGNVAPPQ